MEQPSEFEVDVEMLSDFEIVDQTHTQRQLKIGAVNLREVVWIAIVDEVDDVLSEEQTIGSQACTRVEIKNRSPNPVVIVVALEEIDRTDHKLRGQIVVMHKCFVDLHTVYCLGDFWIVTIKELNMLFIGGSVSSVDKATDDGVVIRKSQSSFVVNPLSEIGVNAEMRLVPIHLSKTVVEAFRYSQAALPPTDGCVRRNEPIPTPSGGEVTN